KAAEGAGRVVSASDPIIVYLDTSDYVRLYTAADDSDYGNIRSSLLSFVDSRTVRIGLSFPIVFELLQDCSPEFLEDRLARANFLERVCGAHAFAHLADMRDGRLHLSDDGIWMPREVVRRFNLSGLEKELTKRIRSDTRGNRKQRRALSRSQTIRDVIRANRDAFDLSASDLPFPFPDEFVRERYFTRYLLREITEAEAAAALARWFTEPSVFFQVWFKYYGQPNLLKSLIDNHIDKFFSTIQGVVDARAAVATKREELMQKIRVMEDAARKLPFALSASILNKAKELRRQLAKRLGLQPVELINLYSTIGRERAQFMEAYFEGATRGAYRSKRSDLVDMMHAMYIPDCDLWRGDRGFSDVLIKNNVAYKERIVRSLEDLPARISDALSRKSSFGGAPR
ncbi:MAG: hypothetical protein KIS68_04455, partial [Bauldia sp.]|nr:hypothetical protein [Bauldia sp.]